LAVGADAGTPGTSAFIAQPSGNGARNGIPVTVTAVAT